MGRINSELEDRSINYTVWETERKKNKRKWTELQRPVRHHQQYKNNGNSRRREQKGAENIFEEIMAEDFPNFMKNVNLNFQEANWPPSRINSETHTETHQNQTIKR